MYCVKCGVKLADTERKCPLCGTTAYHPDLDRLAARPLYPERKMPKAGSGRKAVSGLFIFLFLLPTIVGLFSDWQPDGRLDWFGYAAGALALVYVVFALPVWFRKPNVVIFMPCDFAAAALYLLYIDLASGGGWFLRFALPVTAALGALVCAVTALLRYVRRGRLYIFGGAAIALGGFVLMVELLLVKTFAVAFVGWSVYPLMVLTLLGGGLIYLAVNASARETLKRKLFF